MKTDLYSLVHKAQRARLFALSGAIARADFSDPGEAAGIDAELRRLIEHLRDHAEVESRYIHPLYTAQGSTGAEFDLEHELLEQEMSSLEAIAREGRWKDLHRAYNGFLGRYLVHLEEEEAAQESVLWPRYDAELADVFARFQRERAPEKAREDLEFLLPALSAPELIGMFTGMKLRAPAHAYESARALGEKLVAPERWAKVTAALA